MFKVNAQSFVTTENAYDAILTLKWHSKTCVEKHREVDIELENRVPETRDEVLDLFYLKGARINTKHFSKTSEELDTTFLSFIPLLSDLEVSEDLTSLDPEGMRSVVGASRALFQKAMDAEENKSGLTHSKEGISVIAETIDAIIDRIESSPRLAQVVQDLTWLKNYLTEDYKPNRDESKGPGLIPDTNGTELFVELLRFHAGNNTVDPEDLFHSVEKSLSDQREKCLEFLPSYFGKLESCDKLRERVKEIDKEVPFLDGSEVIAEVEKVLGRIANLSEWQFGESLAGMSESIQVRASPISSPLSTPFNFGVTPDGNVTLFVDAGSQLLMSDMSRVELPAQVALKAYPGLGLQHEVLRQLAQRRVKPEVVGDRHSMMDPGNVILAALGRRGLRRVWRALSSWTRSSTMRSG